MIKYMIKVLFICWGNICRSPLGEFILLDLVAGHRQINDFVIESAATSREEIGNSVYPPALRELSRRGIGSNPKLSEADNKYIQKRIRQKTARQIAASDYAKFDYILIMEEMHRKYVERITGPDVDGKVHCLLEYAGLNRGISDPWYTGDFETAYDEISYGCDCLLEKLRK